MCVGLSGEREGGLHTLKEKVNTWRGLDIFVCKKQKKKKKMLIRIVILTNLLKIERWILPRVNNDFNQNKRVDKALGLSKESES